MVLCQGFIYMDTEGVGKSPFQSKKERILMRMIIYQGFTVLDFWEAYKCHVGFLGVNKDLMGGGGS